MTNCSYISMVTTEYVLFLNPMMKQNDFIIFYFRYRIIVITMTVAGENNWKVMENLEGSWSL